MEFLPYLSIAIALVALFVAFRSSVFARQALAMAKADFEERRRPITLYLIQGLRVVQKEKTYGSFAVTLTNGSMAPETVIRMELRLFFKDASDSLRCTIAAPEASVVTPDTARISGTITPPLNLPARASHQGWISFAIPEIIARERTIEKYQICAFTSNAEATYDAYVLKIVDMP